MDGNSDARTGNKLGKAAGVVRVGVSNDDLADPIAGDAAVPKATRHHAGASRQPRIDEDSVAVFDQDSDPGADCPQLENAVNYSLWFAEHVISLAIDD